MRRVVWWMVGSIAVAVIAILVIAVLATFRTKHRKTPDAANQAALAQYTEAFEIGMTRKQVEDQLRAESTAFFHRCCDRERSAFATLVHVGEEDVPWFCSTWPVYVVIEFRSVQPTEVVQPVSEADLLQSLHLQSNGEGCL